MAVLKGYIKSAGLSRIYQHIQENYCGTISAFRQYREGWESVPDKADPQAIKDYKIPHAENMKRHKLLGALLRKSGINTIQIDGVYKESSSGKTAKESSYFCFAPFNFKKELIGLGDTFEQDTITYAELGGNFELIISHDHIGSDGKMQYKGDVVAEFDLGASYGKDDGEAYSLIRGRPFAWAGWKTTSIQSSQIADKDPYRQYISSLYPTERFSKEAGIKSIVASISTKKGQMNKLLANAEKSYFLRTAGF